MVLSLSSCYVILLLCCPWGLKVRLAYFHFLCFLIEILFNFLKKIKYRVLKRGSVSIKEGVIEFLDDLNFSERNESMIN